MTIRRVRWCSWPPGQVAGIDDGGQTLWSPRLCPAFPSRPAARPGPCPQDEGIRLLLLRGERSAAHVRARTPDRPSLLRRDTGRAAPQHRQAQPAHHHVAHRGPAEPLPPFLRPPVCHARSHQPRRARPFRRAAGRLSSTPTSRGSSAYPPSAGVPDSSTFRQTISATSSRKRPGSRQSSTSTSPSSTVSRTCWPARARP